MGVLEFREYPPEAVFKAQELYCVDRLTYAAVSRRTGISVSALKRWADKYDWRAKREELARLESEIRFNTFKARATMLEKVITKGEALDAFAVAKLETLVIDQARFQAEQHKDDSAPPVELKGATHTAELLEKALSAKLGKLLAEPGSLDLKVLKDLRECLNYLSEMQVKEDANKEVATGLSPEADAKLRRILGGLSE